MINDHGQRVSSDNLDQLTEYAWTVRQALTAQGITGKDGQEIDHIELFASDTEADSKISCFVQARLMTVHRVELERVRKLLAWPQMANLSQEGYGNKPALSVASLLPHMNKRGICDSNHSW